MRRLVQAIVGLLWLPWALAAQGIPDQADALAARVRTFFAGSEQRGPGTPGNLAIEETISAAFSSSGLTHGEVRFQAPVFVPGVTRASVPGVGTIPLQPMHPTVFRPGNFAERSFTAPLVYLGDGSEAALASVSGVNLDGAIAVMEFASAGHWQRLLRFGVQGFVFLAAEEYEIHDAGAKVYGTEVAVPRFFVPEESSDALRKALVNDGRPTPVSSEIVAQPSVWEKRTLRDLWVLIPGTDEQLSRDVVLITAPMDANSIVPQRAEGAQNGLNLFMLMELFERFRENPPQRSIMLAAVNAHTQNYLGERSLAWSLLTPRQAVEDVQDIIAEDLRMQQLLAGHYQRFDLNPPSEADAELIRAMRTLMDSTTGRNVTVKEPIVDLARREVNQVKARKLTLVRADLSEEEIELRRAALEREQEPYVKVLTLFNKVGIKTDLMDLVKTAADPAADPQDRETAESAIRIFREFVNEIIQSRTRWAELNQQDIDRVATNSAVRQQLQAREVVFAICLEFAWTDPRFGFSANNLAGLARWPHAWGVNVARIADDLLGEGPGDSGIYVDALTKRGGLPEGHFFPTESRTVGVFQAAGPTPAFAARNVFSGYGRAFTPGDTFDRLDYRAAVPIFEVFPRLLRAMLADHALTAPSELQAPSGRAGTWAASWGVQVKAFKFDQFSASVLPKMAVPGSAIILHDPADANRPPVRSGDVITGYVALTDERASHIFYGVNARILYSNAFRYDDSFTHVNHAIDAGEAETKMSSTINRGIGSKVLALFSCREFPIWVRENPAAISLSGITEYDFKILSGRLNAAPKRYGFSGIVSTFSNKAMMRMTGPAAIYMDSGERMKLLTTDRVLALHADADEPRGTGFLQPEDLGDDFFATAVHDMSALNHYRLKKLRGTTDELAETFLERGDQAIKQMERSESSDRYLDYLRDLYVALGAHGKAYGRMTTVTNDMLKAVVFYLALMLPFCFFVEKLLFKFKRIESEMTAFGLLFVVTFLVFRAIHPAFAIAQAPEAIFIAFVMGGLGSFVIYILHGRFEGEMQVLFKTYPGMQSGTAGYSTVGQEAMLIGVNNMKRRRIRTALTTATVVLVTFTMLAFTSISKRMSPTVITKSKRTPYTGVMYHWPGNSRMDEATTQAFRELFHGRGEVIVRRWLMPPKTGDVTVPYRLDATTGQHGNIDGALGLGVAENGFLAAVPLQAGRFFSSNDASEAIVPNALAKSLGIDKTNFDGHRLFFNGRELRIAGILRDEEFRLIRDLNQRPIIPIKSLLVQPGEGEDLEAMAAQEEDEGESGVFYVDMSALLILPLNTARSLGGQPYSVSVSLYDDVDLWPVVDDLLTITDASKFHICSTTPFQVGEQSERETGAGIYYIGEGYRTSIGGLTFLIIPLLISSTIILNTMLGSVFERKAEIAIYNAVGLNPTHITIFFLAEAFVYSVIGSVGGYLIGQFTSLALTRTGIISDINLNFSSLSVVYVIAFTVLVVVLSTIYPSLVASKAAVPSGKRKWSLPDHDGNRMHVVFPFIYQPDLVVGLMGYLGDYFGRYTEASFGDLIADMEGIETGKDDEGKPTYGLSYSVALAPFDLGVTQRIQFQAGYDDRVMAYRITMDIQRKSGQDTNWATTNKPFLERLRTYLLHWRNLQSGEHADFSRRGRELLSRREEDV